MESTATTEELSAQIHEFIAARERDGVLGLSNRITPSEWAEVVPRLEPSEIAVLLRQKQETLRRSAREPTRKGGWA